MRKLFSKHTTPVKYFNLRNLQVSREAARYLSQEDIDAINEYNATRRIEVKAILNECFDEASMKSCSER